MRHLPTILGLISLTLAAGCGKKGEEKPATEKVSDRRGLDPAELTANQVLASAVLNAQTEIARRALGQGGNPNHILSTGSSLLTHAIRANLPDLVEILLLGGAEPARRDLRGGSPLVLAIQGQQDGVARLLVTKGAPIEERDPQGRTPLLLALSLDRIELAEWLVNHGARIDVVDMEGNTPLQTARDKNLIDLERIMALRLQIAGGTPLVDLLAGLLHQGDSAGLRILVNQDRGVLDVQLTPGLVSRAVQGTDVPRIPGMLNALFEYQLSPDGVAADSRSPLMEAARLNRVAVMDVLVKRGASIEKRDALALTALLHAVAALSPEAVEYLLEAGAKANYRATVAGQTGEKKACDVARAATALDNAEKAKLEKIKMHLHCGYRRLIFW
jgi:ankyrin repeat protein